uniref:Uncharacterized protein n=1 Tax=Mimiviridae sp. ChoanoV1 TaxID=2596887 RepID=A0A5B8ID93_9VIRU|nr:hypothetical protein 1_61 [Mimiviridae sp. ChoanoV1]
MTVNSKSYGKEYDGNTILLQFKNNDCVFIGSRIFKFKAQSEIIEYVSPIGLNNVPYPYAIDKENNTYLPNEKIYIKGLPKNEYNPYFYLEYDEFEKKYINKKNLKLN